MCQDLHIFAARFDGRWCGILREVPGTMDDAAEMWRAFFLVLTD
jgi:hypothetical protein